MRARGHLGAREGAGRKEGPQDVGGVVADGEGLVVGKAGGAELLIGGVEEVLRGGTYVSPALRPQGGDSGGEKG